MIDVRVCTRAWQQARLNERHGDGDARVQWIEHRDAETGAERWGQLGEAKGHAAEQDGLCSPCQQSLPCPLQQVKGPGRVASDLKGL